MAPPFILRDFLRVLRGRLLTDLDLLRVLLADLRPRYLFEIALDRRVRLRTLERPLVLRTTIDIIHILR